jgi:hypothetical protein
MKMVKKNVGLDKGEPRDRVRNKSEIEFKDDRVLSYGM